MIYNNDVDVIDGDDDDNDNVMVIIKIIIIWYGPDGAANFFLTIWTTSWLTGAWPDKNSSNIIVIIMILK